MIGAERPRDLFPYPREHRQALKALERELSSVAADVDDAVRGSLAWRERGPALLGAQHRAGNFTHAQCRVA